MWADGLPLASRLLAIHEGLAAVLGDFRPAEAAVEQTFVNKDGVATLKLGQARGIAMLVPALAGLFSSLGLLYARPEFHDVHPGDEAIENLNLALA